MAEFIPKLRQKADEFLTNYLQNTTTDQEILDFYGEGNIIGRKGALDTPGAAINEAYEAYKLPGDRPVVNRKSVEPEGLLGLGGKEERLINLEGSIDPKTKNPWQMKFETLPFPGGGSPTAAATRFLKDFRVPVGTTVDYGFETSPNVVDLNTREITELINDPRSYADTRAAFLAEDAGTPLSTSGPLRQSTQQDIERIRTRAEPYTRFGGKILTPSDWKTRGFEIPADLKNETLNKFKTEIMKSEQPFGSVSQLTPVREFENNVRPGGDPDWRANLYERRGFAGPMTEVSVSGAYGPKTGNVQMFTRGNERLLPIQPYTEFLDKFDASKPSALNTPPAADFTPFQKGIGTRNYLIGRNILQGRGELGQVFRPATGAVVGAASSLLNPEVAKAVEKDQYGDAASAVARDVATGAITEAGIRAATPVARQFVPGLVRAAAPLVRLAGPVGVGAALLSQGQKGSLTDVITRKAAENPIPFTPRVKPDPKTDVGRRTGNEFLYMLNQFRKGRIPYTGK